MEVPSAPVEKITSGTAGCHRTCRHRPFSSPGEGLTAESFKAETAPANDHGCGGYPFACALRSMSRIARPAGNGMSTS